MNNEIKDLKQEIKDLKEVVGFLFDFIGVRRNAHGYYNPMLEFKPRINITDLSDDLDSKIKDIL